MPRKKQAAGGGWQGAGGRTRAERVWLPRRDSALGQTRQCRGKAAEASGERERARAARARRAAMPVLCPPCVAVGRLRPGLLAAGQRHTRATPHATRGAEAARVRADRCCAGAAAAVRRAVPRGPFI